MEIFKINWMKFFLVKFDENILWKRKKLIKKISQLFHTLLIPHKIYKYFFILSSSETSSFALFPFHIQIHSCIYLVLICSSWEVNAQRKQKKKLNEENFHQTCCVFFNAEAQTSWGEEEKKLFNFASSNEFSRSFFLSSICKFLALEKFFFNLYKIEFFSIK